MISDWIRSSFAADPQLDELLGPLDGVPLAVELLGYATQGQPDLEDVAARWPAARTGMLARMGGASRELSVAVSVEASLTGPLITAAAAQLAALLGVLPSDGELSEVAWFTPGQLPGLHLSRFGRASLKATGRI